MKKEVENKEKLILQAAENEFMTKGFDGAKTTSIAKSAGVTHAMLHYYYRTKENLFKKVFEEKLTLIANSIVSSFTNPNLPLLERLKLGIQIHFDFLVQNPNLPRFIINELVSRPDRRQIFEQRIKNLSSIVIPSLQKELDDEATKGEIEKINAFDLILDIVSMNIFVFVAFPLLESFVILPNEKDKFLENRKQENVEMIMRRLKK